MVSIFETYVSISFKIISCALLLSSSDMNLLLRMDIIIFCLIHFIKSTSILAVTLFKKLLDIN